MPIDHPLDVLDRWFAADDIVGVNDGGTVQTWADASGSGTNLTQSSAGVRPIWREDRLNGWPALDFTAGKWLRSTTGALTGNQPHTIVALLRRIATPGGTAARGFAYYSGTATTNRNSAIGVRGSSALALYGGFGQDTFTGGTLDTDWHILIKRYTGSAIEAFRDGDLDLSRAVTYDLGSTDIAVGGYFFQFGLMINTIDFEIVALGFANHSLSDPEREDLEAWLNDRYLEPPTTPEGTATLSGGGRIHATGTSARAGTRALSDGGRVQAIGVAARRGAARLRGGGSLSAVGASARTGTARILGGGLLAMLGASARLGAVRLPGGGRIRAAAPFRGGWLVISVELDPAVRVATALDPPVTMEPAAEPAVHILARLDPET